MKRLLNLLVFTLLAFVFLRASTFGWRFWGNNLMSTVKEENQLVELLEKHVRVLSDTIGDRSVFRYNKLKLAEKYIVDQFSQLGYSVELQPYTVLGNTVNNIIITKLGNSNPEEIVVVGAHYDTCANPGADDNASAISGLIELARSISNKETGRTVQFVAFVNEEPPFFKTELMGSRVYTNKAKEDKRKIKAAIILEMIGYYCDKPFSQRYPPLFGLFYPNKGNFIAVVGNFSSSFLTKKIASEFKRSSQFPIEAVSTFSSIPGIDFSDHWSFWQEEYPAVMITDTSFYRNPHYHSNSDTYDTLDYEKMAEVVKGLEYAIISSSK